VSKRVPYRQLCGKCGKLHPPEDLAPLPPQTPVIPNNGPLLSACMAVPPVYRCQRRIAVSTYSGSSSMRSRFCQILKAYGNPCIFPCHLGNRAESGSLQTASTASKFSRPRCHNTYSPKILQLQPVSAWGLFFSLRRKMGLSDELTDVPFESQVRDSSLVLCLVEKFGLPFVSIPGFCPISNYLLHCPSCADTIRAFFQDAFVCTTFDKRIGISQIPVDSVV